MRYTTQTRTQTRRLERGLSLLEVGMALALAAVVIAGLTMYASNASEKMKRRGDAQHLLVLAQAGEAYITKNQGTLLASGGLLDPTSHPLGTVVEISATQLQDDGDLSKSVSGAFGNSQTLELMMQAVLNPAWGQPGASQYLLKGMVISYGNTLFSDDQAGEIVSLAGAAGGYASRTVDVGNIDGAGGAWQEHLHDWSRAAHPPLVGHVMALVGMSYGASASVDGPWLARKVIDAGAAPHEHNTMQTDINMTEIGGASSHSLVGAASVQASQYQGFTPGGDISIGTAPTASNVSINYANTFYVGGVGGAGGTGEGFTLTNLGTGANSSHWNAEEPQIVARQDDNSGSWDTVFDSQPNGILSLSTPSSTQAAGGRVPGMMKLTASGQNSEIDLNAPDSDSAINLTATGDNSQINLKTLGTNGALSMSGKTITAAFEQVKLGESSGTNYLEVDWPNSAYATVLEGQSVGIYTDSNIGSNWYCMLCRDPNGGNGGDAVGGVDIGYDFSGTYGAGTKNVDLFVNGSVLAAYSIKGSTVRSDSDRRLKYDIKPLHNALDNIERLNGYSFKWKKDATADIGVIAQEVESVYPQLVATSSRDGMKSVEYGNLVAPLIEAVKTLHHMLNDAIATFSKQIAALQQDDHTLQAQVQTLSEQDAALKAELAEQHLDLVKLKHAIHQPLTVDERTLCGAACAP